MKRQRNSDAVNRKNYIILPVLFCILIYTILYFGGEVVLEPIISMFSTVTQSSDSSEAGKSIFDENVTPSEGGTISLYDFRFPQYGEQFGRITVGGTQVNAPLYMGDGTRELRYGAGVYDGAKIPGDGGTVLIAGHSRTWFSSLDEVEKGSRICITTNYGEYIYEVTKFQVANAQDTTAYDLSAGEDNVILYTCYPLDTYGYKPDRLFVYGKYVSGPKIDRSREALS